MVGAVTTTYAYDHAGQRVKYSNGTTTTRYPSKNYNIEGSNQVKHIFAGSEVVATVKGTGATAAVFTVHTDHLSGSSAVTTSAGVQEEVMDYFPYGDIRIDQKAGTFDEQRKFAGHEYDAETELSYMNARYYKSDIGRFVSQDPAFLLLGADNEFEGRYSRPLAVHLMNPQSLNSYSYTNNNPLTFGDASGEILPVIVGIGAVAWGALEVGLTVYDGYTTYQTIKNPEVSVGEKAGTVGLFALGVVGPLGGYGLADDAAKALISKTDDAIGLLSNANHGYKLMHSADKAANAIANGHAYEKHIGEFGGVFKSREEFAGYIKNVINNPTEAKQLKDGRVGFWDDSMDSVVVYNPNDPDLGTAFRPTQGKAYFDNDLQ